jgi:hypothetical protein
MSGVHIDSSDAELRFHLRCYLEVAWSAAACVNWRWTESAYTLYDERGMRAVAMERGVSASPGVLAAQSSEAAHGNTFVVGSNVGLHAGQRPSSSKQRTDYQ